MLKLKETDTTFCRSYRKRKMFMRREGNVCVWRCEAELKRAIVTGPAFRKERQKKVTLGYLVGEA